MWVAILCTCSLIAFDLTVIFQWYSCLSRRLFPALRGPSSQPIHHAWNRPVDGGKGHCINDDRFFIGSGSVNVLLNVLVFVLVSRSVFCYFFTATDLIAAYAAPMASSNHNEAAADLDGHLYAGWIVSVTKCSPTGTKLTHSSVVLVSIIWVVVLARIEQDDVTCEFDPFVSLDAF